MVDYQCIELHSLLCNFLKYWIQNKKDLCAIEGHTTIEREEQNKVQTGMIKNHPSPWGGYGHTPQALQSFSRYITQFSENWGEKGNLKSCRSWLSQSPLFMANIHILY
ncbi:hypothetical protein GDO81_024609 [Engystomops pustulosus]|uniref:Uncharacterized protein n=1 Tax=Engystomops pustulosus TaxID=76066 RepID=A0AAV6Z334_ENGPU|nr:hypothetical protein GDO81_024609 [Engystomops pustulosus]